MLVFCGFIAGPLLYCASLVAAGFPPSCRSDGGFVFLSFGEANVVLPSTISPSRRPGPVVCCLSFYHCFAAVKQLGVLVFG